MSSIGLISENDNSTVLAEYTGLNRVATSFQSEDALEKELIKTLVEQGYEVTALDIAGKSWFIAIASIIVGIAYALIWDVIYKKRNAGGNK